MHRIYPYIRCLIFLLTAAEQVARQEQLKINNSWVQIKLMKSTVLLPVLQGPFEENMFLVSGLPASFTDEEDLKSFFAEEKPHSEIQVSFCRHNPGAAMIQFIHEPGITCDLVTLGESTIFFKLSTNIVNVSV